MNSTAYKVLFVWTGIIIMLSNNSYVHAQILSKYEQPISAPIFLSTPRQVSIASQDSFVNINEDSLIAASLSPVDTTIREGKSTTIATLASMILPGAGQLYNESYWKAPVVWGFGYYFYSVYKNQDDLYKERKNQYEDALIKFQQTTSGSSAYDSLSRFVNGYKEQRDFYKNQRNEFGWYIVMTYLLNVLDAYVDAALYNFEVSPNLQGTNEWRMRMRFPLR